MTAIDRLRAMTAAGSQPTLSEDDLADLLARFSVVDSAGLPPGDSNWTPTYDMRAAAREGWRLKAARAVELISTDLDGDRMSANQIFEHCQAMIRSFSSARSVRYGSTE
jgi:hypothetical protein